MNEQEYEELFKCLDNVCDYCVMYCCLDSACPIFQTKTYYATKRLEEKKE